MQAEDTEATKKPQKIGPTAPLHGNRLGVRAFGFLPADRVWVFCPRRMPGFYPGLCESDRDASTADMTRCDLGGASSSPGSAENPTGGSSHAQDL
jgi:hypothetical protein